MRQEKLVSVIVPFYNNAPYIGRAIESLLHQTYKNIEIILVDDGSTDNSLFVAKSYQAKDKRIRIIHDKKNRGVGFARQRGVMMARGEFVAWQDADDFSAPNRIATLIHFLQKNKKCHAVISNYYHFRLYGFFGVGIRRVVKGRAGKGMDGRHYRGMDISFPPATLFVRRALYRLLPYRPLRLAEDLDWCYRFLERGYNMGCHPDYLYYYHRRQGSLSYQRFESLVFIIVARLARVARLYGLPDPLKDLQNISPDIIFRFFGKEYAGVKDKVDGEIAKALAEQWGRMKKKPWLFYRSWLAMVRLQKLLRKYNR